MATKHLSDQQILAQIAGVREREARLAATEPRAKHASYSRKTGMITVELSNHTVFAFPAQLAQGLRGAPHAALANVEVSPSGEGLHWESLDVDLSVPALIQGMFGTKEWMRELARRGGQSRSAAKVRAARENGARGGRPPVRKRRAKR